MSISPVRAFAFFDVDETLISIKSMVSFQDYWFIATGDDEARASFWRDMARLRDGKASRETLNRCYYASFAGRAVGAVADLAVAWFNEMSATTRDLFHPSVVAALFRHQDIGQEAVLVSGSFPALLSPIAARLGVRHILASDMEVADGCYTGRILPPQTIGLGKAEAMTAFLQRAGVSPSRCHAYGDDISDLPMLGAVGWPVVVREDDAEMVAVARSRGWPVLSPR
ncbi:MAG TPA: HAD-IB family hydrolase [Telmatospirillum sp.]|nr:HAD-IB family hydrolase [Telmatospirillum sp.]